MYHAYKPRPDGTVPIDPASQAIIRRGLNTDSGAKLWARQRFGPTAVCYHYYNDEAFHAGQGRRIL
jgi:hypothetical protein